MKREFRYKPGQVIPGSRLLVVRHVGYGGMGAIYECEQTLTGLRYVVKVIHPELLAGKGMLARMQQEARVLAQLTHPNIIQIFWADMTNEDPPLFYYVMEKLDGYTLRRLQQNAVSRGVPLRMDFILRSMVSLLNALAHAHSYGMIHRDVKPDNIFVHTGEIIKLLDWGIAAVRGKRRTTSRGFVGTVGYGAPEQFLGGEPTAATDIWAVGIITYELSAAREVFAGEPTEYALAQAVLTKTPAAPSVFRPEVSPALDELILRMLDKDPKKRPSDALSVASELEKIRKDLLIAKEAPLPELMGLELLEGMGPPSITNVEEDFEEEEEPPPSALEEVSPPAQGAGSPAPDAAKPPDVPPAPDAAGPPDVLPAPPQQLHTDVLTPSAIDRALGKPVEPAPPPLLATPTQPSPEPRKTPKADAPQRSSHADGEQGSGPTDDGPQRSSLADGQPGSSLADQLSRLSSVASVPWAKALRSMGGPTTTTVRRPPLPETLALSHRDAKTPAFGVVPIAIRGNSDAVHVAEQAEVAPQMAVAVTERAPAHRGPAPEREAGARPLEAEPVATEVPSRPYTAPIQTDFQPFKAAPTAEIGISPKPAGQSQRPHRAEPAQPEAKALREPNRVLEPAQAFQPERVAAEVQEHPARQRYSPATPPRQPAHRPAAAVLPSGSDVDRRSPAFDEGPTLPTGAPCRPAPPKPSPAILPSRPLIDWDAPGAPAVQLPAPLPDEIESRASAIESQGSAVRIVTSAPSSVTTVPRALGNDLQRRVWKVFGMSLVTGLSVFGGIAAVYMYSSPRRLAGRAVSAPSASAAIAIPVPPPSWSASPEERAATLPLPLAPVSAAPLAAVSANPPVPLALPSSPPIAPALPPESVGPTEVERPADARTDPDATARDPVASSKVPPPAASVVPARSKVSRQHAPNQKAYHDLPFHVSGAESVPNEEEPFGAAFLSHGKPTSTSVPTPSRPRPVAPAPAPNRGAP